MEDKTEQQQQEHADMLAECKHILEKYNIPVILTGSALLGAYRDGDLVPWCPGVVISSYYKPLAKNEDAVIEDLKNAGFNIARHYRNKEDYKIRVTKNSLNVEIFGYSKNKKYFYRKLSNKMKIIPKRFLLKPFGQITVRGETYNTPKDIEGFLEWVYVDWKTPTRSKSPSTYKRKNHMVMDK